MDLVELQPNAEIPQGRLTVLEDKSIERSGYHGLLNLPAKLSVEPGEE